MAAFARSAWEWLDSFPPILIRLSARRGWGRSCRGLDTAEIAVLADIPFSRVQEIAEAFFWADFSVGETRRFLAACGIDPTNPNDRERLRSYHYTCTKQNRTQPPGYLRRHPAWETEFLPLIHRLKSRPTSCSASASSNT